LVSRDTVEQEFALKRQLFLCEQGYAYNILDRDQVAGALDFWPERQHRNEAARKGNEPGRS
jgi:hypothetical protein